MKICSKCKENKKQSQFYRSHSECKKCSIADVKEWTRKNPEKAALNVKKSKQRNPEKYADIGRRRNLKANFGITIEQYDELLERQNHLCAVCKKHTSSFKMRLAVDHEHGSGPQAGAIRGLLCSYCNRAVVGRHKDPELLRSAARYLEGPFTGLFVPKRSKKPAKRKSRKG